MGRLRFLLPILALAVVPPTLAGVFLIRGLRFSLASEAARQAAFETRARALALEEFLTTVRQDLEHLSRTRVLQELARAAESGAPEAAARARGEAERELVSFCQARRAFYQLRLLDRRGAEQLRLNVEGGRPRPVPAARLQNKSDRYYVREALALAPGEVYVSPMDLNVEWGQVEDPARPVVRYATALAGSGPGGVVVINLDGEHLLAMGGRLAPGSQAWLVGRDGRYLAHAGPDGAGRIEYHLSRRRLLEADHGPARARALLESGAEPVETDRWLVSSAPLRLRAGPKPGQEWRLIVAQERDPLLAPVRRLVFGLYGVLAAMVAAAGAAGFYLARSFEGVTRRLAAAREELAETNAHLAGEVSRQTGQLARLQSGLARADRLAAVGQMTAQVMHEVGNPLAAIKARIQVAEEAAVCPTCHPLLSELHSEVDRLAGVLRSFSRYSRQRRLHRAPVDLAELARGVERLLAPELEQRGLELALEGGGAGEAVLGDAEQLRQVLLNLVLNAAEASSAGGRIEIAIAPGPAAGEHALEVKDHGVGIPPENLEKIWEPFFTTRPDGTGLGLAICRQIVTEHGGRIGAASRPGEGTTVTAVLPACTDVQPSGAPLAVEAG